jgi:hypothetical protein
MFLNVVVYFIKTLLGGAHVQELRRKLEKLEQEELEEERQQQQLETVVEIEKY